MKSGRYAREIELCGVPLSVTFDYDPSIPATRLDPPCEATVVVDKVVILPQKESVDLTELFDRAEMLSGLEDKIALSIEENNE